MIGKEVSQEDYEFFFKEVVDKVLNLHNAILLAAIKGNITYTEFHKNYFSEFSGMDLNNSFESAAKDLVDWKLTTSDKPYITLSDEGRKLLAILPKKYVALPYTFFLEEMKNDALAKRRDNFTKIHWFLLKFGGSIIGLVIGILVTIIGGIIIYQYQQQHPKGTQIVSPPKKDTLKVPTTILSK